MLRLCGWEVLARRLRGGRTGQFYGASLTIEARYYGRGKNNKAGLCMAQIGGRLLCVALLLATIAGCGERNISGSYLAKGQGSIGWLQIVQTPDKHLTGQYETVTVNNDGKLDYHAAPVTGAIDGETVTLAIKVYPLLPPVPRSGIIKGNDLTLTGGESGQPMVVHRAKQDEYTAARQELEAEARVLRAGQADAEQRQRVERQMGVDANNLRATISQAVWISGRQPKLLERVQQAEAEYVGITQNIRNLMRERRELVSNGESRLEIGRNAVALNQKSIQTDQLHVSVSGGDRATYSEIESTMKRLKAAESRCQSTQTAPGDMFQPGIKAWVDACQALREALPQFQRTEQTLRQAFVQIESVYQRELAEQNNLVRTR